MTDAEGPLLSLLFPPCPCRSCTFSDRETGKTPKIEALRVKAQ